MESKMSTPLISIIVPVYNIKEYLPRCVDSLREQTYPNIEILLVDDGSTDGTGVLCDELAAKDGRIRVFHKENGGSSSARNLGLSKAQGEYIGFVDSDDYVEPDMYECLYRALQEQDAQIAQVGRNEIDEQGNLLPDICIPPEETEFLQSRDFLKELLMHRGDCSFCTKLFAKSLLKGREFPVGLLNEDFHLLVNMLPKVKGIVSLPGYKYHVFYRIGSNSRKQNKEDFSRVFADSVDNADMVSGIVEKEFEDLKKVAFRFGIFQRLEYLLHIPVSQMTKDNAFYQSVIKYMRKNWWGSMMNPHLTLKNKCYHTLFVPAPKLLRKLHRRIRGI